MAETRTRFRRLSRALMVGVAAVGTVAALLPVLPTAASEAPRDEASEAEVLVRPAPVRMQLDLGANDSQHMWVWSKGQRGYLLKTKGLGAGSDLGYTSITALGLGTGETSQSAPLTVLGYRGPWNYSAGTGLAKTVAIDEEGGRLFVATSSPPLSPGPAVVTGTATRSLAGQACTEVSHTVGAVQCLSGFSVVDASSLEHVRHVPLRGVQVDAPMVAPQLLAMDYSPPFDGLPAKVHMLVLDSPHGHGQLDSLTLSRYSGRNIHNLIYAVQFDPDTGQQDWAVRLDGCRGTLAGRSGGYNEYEVNNYPHAATIFRSRLPGDHAVYAACHNSSQSFTGAVVRVPLTEEGAASVTTVPPAPGPGELEVEPGQFQDGPPGAPGVGAGRPLTVDGPDRVYQMHADPESGRILMEVQDGRPKAAVWYVFDTSVMQFIGTIGIGGPIVGRTVLATVSQRTGRLYVLAPPGLEDGKSFTGGLFVADFRRTPVPQALHFPDFAGTAPKDVSHSAQPNEPWYRYALSPQHLGDGGTRLWFPSNLNHVLRPAYLAIDDLRPAETAPPPPDFEGRTLDLVEAEGVTSSSVDGVARGYGFRALLVAGAEAASRAGPIDPVGAAAQCNDPSWASEESSDPWSQSANVLDAGLDAAESGSPSKRTLGQPGPCDRVRQPIPTGCTDATRELVLAMVGPRGPSVIDANGSRGAAAPFVVDSTTLTDVSAPASRCSKVEWEALWSTALFGRAPVSEPSADGAELQLVAECISTGETPTAREGDAVLDGYSASVSCADEEASGHAYTRGGSLPGVTVAEAMSNFRIYRDPDRGVVSRVESVARGIAIDGAVRIDTVRGIAESWANGHAFIPPVGEEGGSYNPNCDFERSAGTCFQRHLFGLWTPGYQCGPCGDEAAFVQGLNAVLNPYVLVRLREPDQRLRQGADNGYAAAIQKPEHERFADLVLNNDLLQTVLPTLEIVRPAPPNRMASRGGPRGRQIYQFAGVEVSSSYGITCLLVYDEAANTCGLPAEPPGAITVSLSDPDGKPLAGGAFEVRFDVDADGVLGLKDTLLPDGACVTADDGVGTCSFENLQPGGYLVSQVAAPAGYAKSAEPFVVELASGERRTVAFTNVSNVSTIDLKATDEAGAPLSGASFAAYPDPDADGKVAPEAKPAAECTTNAEGACQMKVPAGSYVLVQIAAPGGLEGIEPVAFTFASGGQVAAVTVVNYPPGTPQAPEAAPASIAYSPTIEQAPPTETVGGYDAPVVAEQPDVALAPPITERIGGTVTQVIRAPGDALRLLARDPKQAVAWTAALALFVLAVMAVRRRQQALALVGGR